MKTTKHTQQKLQDILKTQDYTVRYEKGNFNGGYCMVMDRKLIIINKFHPLEGKINTLSEIIRELELDRSALTPDQEKVVDRIKAQATDLPPEKEDI
mgnify:CR=1 FL=1